MNGTANNELGLGHVLRQAHDSGIPKGIQPMRSSTTVLPAGVAGDVVVASTSHGGRRPAYLSRDDDQTSSPRRDLSRANSPTAERHVPRRARPTSAAPLPSAVSALLRDARRIHTRAVMAPQPHERYAAAHLAALRASAAVLAARAQPAPGNRPRLRTAWDLLTRVAPELSEWALFFAAGAPKRAAADAGLRRAVTAREADDLVRDVETFLGLVGDLLGVPVARGTTGAPPGQATLPANDEHQVSA